MRFKYAELTTKDNETITFGKSSINKESKFQLVKIEGVTKASTNIFKNETLDSQLRIFRGNRLSERQILMRIALQPKESLITNTQDKWDQKEQDIIDLINSLSTTDIQKDGDESSLVLTSRSDRKFLFKKVIVQSIETVDTAKAYNNYIELDLTIMAYDPYIYDGTGTNIITLDLSRDSILTDFVKEPITSYDSQLELELESPIERYEVINVRDGYISNDGIFYAVDSYGENIDETHNGQFWITSSLNEDILNLGVRTYPTITIYGYAVNPRIENKTTNQVFELNMTIQENERVVVDMEAKTANLIYLNNDGIEVIQDVRNFISLESSWIYLQKGTNVIESSASEAGIDSFKIDIEWEVRYEGIESNMAITKLKDTGYHNSNTKIGNWDVPQVIGNDRPRGDKAYDSWKMTKGLTFHGTTKNLSGMNIISQDGITSLTKGEGVIKGHLFSLEEDLIITGDVIVLGINRNEDTRETYIKDEISGYVTIQEELTQDSGIYETKIWEKIDGEWRYVLPISKTIKKYTEVLTLNSGGNTIYDVEVINFPQNLIDGPELYNYQNTIITLLFNKIGTSGNKILRIRKGNSYLDILFDEDAPTLGVNTISFYIDSEGKFKATIGRKNNMAITKLKTGLFNTNSYDNPDRRYSSLDFVKSNSFAHNGFVSGNRSEFSITNPSGLVININEGLYNIGGHYIDNDTVKTFQLQPTSAGFERYDIIVVGVTRDGARTIDGTSLSREGYVRVIQGTQAAIDTAQPSFNEIVSEDFLESSGTKEVELAIIKVVSGTITEIVDRRLSTTTEEIKVYTSKLIDSTNLINMSEYKLQSKSTIDANGFFTSNPSDLENMVVEMVIRNPEIENGLDKISFTINEQEVLLDVVYFEGSFNLGDNIFRFSFRIDETNSKLYLLHIHPEEFLGGLILDSEWESSNPSSLSENGVINTYFSSRVSTISEITDDYVEIEFLENATLKEYKVVHTFPLTRTAINTTTSYLDTWSIDISQDGTSFTEFSDGRVLYSGTPPIGAQPSFTIELGPKYKLRFKRRVIDNGSQPDSNLNLRGFKPVIIITDRN